jgi:hypothetical protein
MPSERALDAVRAHNQEQRVARGVALSLPILTISGAAIIGAILGPATAILVLTAGLLLGVIAILWGSLRVLSGDSPLSPELEALDMEMQGIDALASRKKMLLRALKDLENERGIGKIEDDDFDQIALTYRTELKALMRRIDESLAPHRTKADEVARAFLVKAGIVDHGYRGDQPAVPEAEKSSSGDVSAEEDDDDDTKRVVCPKCKASNEVDAKFCKGCATNLTVNADSDDEDEDDDDE